MSAGSGLGKKSLSLGGMAAGESVTEGEIGSAFGRQNRGSAGFLSGLASMWIMYYATDNSCGKEGRKY